jgi:hypothetical protein
MDRYLTNRLITIEGIIRQAERDITACKEELLKLKQFKVGDILYHKDANKLIRVKDITPTTIIDSNGSAWTPQFCVMATEQQCFEFLKRESDREEERIIEQMRITNKRKNNPQHCLLAQLCPDKFCEYTPKLCNFDLTKRSIQMPATEFMHLLEEFSSYRQGSTDNNVFYIARQYLIKKNLI